MSRHQRTRESGPVPTDERTNGCEGWFLATVSEEDGLSSARSNTIDPGVHRADSAALSRRPAEEDALGRFQRAFLRILGKKLDMGKSCVRSKKVDHVPLTVIGQAIKRVPAKKFIEHYESAVKPFGRPTSKKGTTQAYREREDGNITPQVRYPTQDPFQSHEEAQDLRRDAWHVRTQRGLGRLGGTGVGPENAIGAKKLRFRAFL